MTTFTIDIPEKETETVISILKKHGVKVHQSKKSSLDKLGADDYRKHFINQAKIGHSLLLNKI